MLGDLPSLLCYCVLSCPIENQAPNLNHQLKTTDTFPLAREPEALPCHTWKDLKRIHASKTSTFQKPPHFKVKQDAAGFAGAAHTGLLSPTVVSRQGLVLSD